MRPRVITMAGCLAGLLLSLGSLGGCGGYYILTVPDVVAKPDDQVPVLARLQRNDFFVLAPAVEGTLIHFQVDQPGCLERGSYTDNIGYAGTLLTAPSDPGRFRLAVGLQDIEGEEFAGEAGFYVWDATSEVAAVDLDSLPGPTAKDHGEAAIALARVAQHAHLLYLTRDQAGGARLHTRLTAGGYPDGPILLWQSEQWHLVREGYQVPRIVVESRLVSQLPEMRRRLGGLNVGLCGTAPAARAFQQAGMRVVIVGSANVAGDNVTQRKNWADLADRGL